MSYLILDTETSGLDNRKDHIIEIGAIVANFNTSLNKLEFLDSYQSLIKLDSILDERVTELTGITLEDLSQAPSLYSVQEQWREFVSQHDITHIVGHSLSFDTGFLRAKEFYIPDATELDTLDIIKVVAPDYKALNLDFLNKSYDLDQYFSKPTEIGKMKNHRALYDSFLAAGLYNLALSKLKDSNITTDFLIAYQELINQKLNIQDNYMSPQVTWDSSDTPTVDILKADTSNTNIHQFKLLSQDEASQMVISSLYNKIKNVPNRQLVKVLLGIWFAILNPNLLGKVSINGTLEKKFYNLVLLSMPSDSESIVDGYSLVNPESIILDNSELTTNNLSILDLLDYIELYNNLSGDLTSYIKQFILIKEQLLRTLSYLTNTSYYSIVANSTTLEHTDLINILNNLHNKLTELYEHIYSTRKSTLLEDKLLKYIKTSINVIKENELSFFFHVNDIKIYCQTPFDIKAYTNTMVKEAKSISTSLTPADYLVFMNHFKLESNANIQYGPEVLVPNSNSLIEDLQKDTHRIKIVLVGKSSNLKSLPAKLKLEGIDYLDLSNVGSATKVLSKIEFGYTGVAVLGYKNIDFITNFLKLQPEEVSFYFYGDIFLPLTKSIKQLNNTGVNQFEFDKQISKLYLNLLIAKIYKRFKQKTNHYQEL
jgi:DNA polymerase III subunit epsilon